MKNIIVLILIFFFIFSCEKKETLKNNKIVSNNNVSKDSITTLESVEENRKVLPIKNIIKLAQQHFLVYKKKLIQQNTEIGIHEAYTGDYTNDGIEDIVIYYSIEPTDGGNYIAGQGLALYKNSGNDVQFITTYSPDYYFSFDKVTGGNIVISKNEYAENDPTCCPSIRKLVELTVIKSEIYERNIK